MRRQLKEVALARAIFAKDYAHVSPRALDFLECSMETLKLIVKAHAQLAYAFARHDTVAQRLDCAPRFKLLDLLGCERSFSARRRCWSRSR